MKSHDLDNFFRNKLNNLEGLPPNVNFDMEQTFGKLEARMNKKIWRPKLLDLAASIVLLFVSGWLVTSEIEQHLSAKKLDILSQKISAATVLVSHKCDKCDKKEKNSFSSIVSEKKKAALRNRNYVVKHQNSTKVETPLEAPQEISEMTFAFFNTENAALTTLPFPKVEINTSDFSTKKTLKIYYPFSKKNKKVKKPNDNLLAETSANELNFSIPAGFSFTKGNAAAVLTAMVSYKKQNSNSAKFTKYSLGMSSYVLGASQNENSKSLTSNTFIEVSLGKGNSSKQNSLIDAVGVGYQVQGNSFGKRAIKLNVRKSFKNNKVHFSPEILINEDFRNVSGGFRLTIGNV